MTCDTAPLISSPVQPQETTICVALELSRSTWLVGINLPGSEKISKHTVAGGDGAALLALLAKIKDKAEHQLGRALRLVVIQEAGRDGFWIHRLLEAAGIQSQVVDPGRVEKLGVPASRIPSFSGSAFTCAMSQYCSTGAAM